MGVDILKYREACGYAMGDVAEPAHGAAPKRTKDIQNISDPILPGVALCTA